MKRVILILLLFFCSLVISYAFGNKEKASDASEQAEDASEQAEDASEQAEDASEQAEDASERIDYTKEISISEDILPMELNKINFNQIDNKYMTFNDDVNIDELIYRSRNNLLYLYDYRYTEAMKIKQNGQKIFLISTISSIAFGGLAFASSAFIEDSYLSQGLSIPFTVLSSVLGFGGAIPGLVMWNIGSARELNIVRKYYRFDKKIKLLDLYVDEDSNYFEND